MYTVFIGDINGNNKILYYPANKDYSIYDTELETSIGECGTFTFKVPYNNANYTELKEQKIITIHKNNSEYWRGYIKEITTTIDKSLEVYCIEDLGWLAYEFTAPTSETVTKAQKLQYIVALYNEQVGVDGTAKVFEAGYVTSDISRKYQTTYESSLLDDLRTLAGDNNYVRVRRSNGHRYIDIVTLDNYGDNSDQPLRIGQNILNYVKELTTSYMLNVIYPYGAEIEGEEVYEGVAKRLVGYPISNMESINQYGRIAKNIFFNTSDIDTLQEQAQAYLNRNKNPRISLELTALDLADLGNDINSLKLGDKVELQAEAFGISSMWIPITKLSINLQKPDSNKLTLSSTVSTATTLTSQYTATETEVQKLPNTLLQSTRQNMISLLNGASGGYVLEKVNSQGQRQELWITDSLNKDTATKKWVWNENGLGYMFKDEDGNWQTEIAMNMNGELLAKRGVIGSDSEAWDIGAHSIYNGTTSPIDYETYGIYVGTDGILNVGEGTAGETVYTKIQGGKISSTSKITSASIQAGVLTVGSISNGDNYTNINKASVSKLLVGNFVDANGNNTGYTGTYTAVSTSGSVRITVVNGLITKVEQL